MGVPYGMIFAGMMGLLAGGYIVTGGNMTGLAFFAFGWVLIILGIRKIIVSNKDKTDAGR